MSEKILLPGNDTKLSLGNKLWCDKNLVTATTKANYQIL